MRCSVCGMERNPSERFCRGCGKVFEEDEYYIWKNGTNQPLGPITESDLKSKLATNQLSTEDSIARVGEQNWTPIAQTPFARITSPLNPPFPNQPANPGYTNPPVNPGYANPQANPNFGQQPFYPGFASPPAPASPYQTNQVQHVVHHHSLSEEPEGSLPTIAMVSGIVCASLMLVGLIPCLGWLNWFVLFGGGISKILCWVAIFTDHNPNGRNKAIIGLILVAIALFVGFIRLIIGGGCL